MAYLTHGYVLAPEDRGMTMRFPISKRRRNLWKKRVKDFWLDFSHNLIGIVGLVMLAVYVFVAVFAPYIAPYSSESVRVSAPLQADKYAVPSWIGIFSPGLSDLPPQTTHTSNWTVQEPPASITWQKDASGELTLCYNASKTGSTETVSFNANSTFDYPWTPMDFFSLRLAWEAEPDTVKVYEKWISTLNMTIFKHLGGSMAYMLKINLVTPNNESYPIWDQNWYQYKSITAGKNQPKPAFWTNNISSVIVMPSSVGTFPLKLGYLLHESVALNHDIFSSKGLYTLQLQITFKPGEIDGEQVALENATGRLTFSNVDFIIWGLRWGVLGTDGLGHDVFSQIIYGAAISLTIGIAAAVIGTSIGLVVGVTAGYLGATVDEVLMRTVDILLCLPLLPILLVLIAIFGYSTWYIILIIAVFGWQGLSRLVRSSVLSIRETAFIESALSSGASKAYIITKHILPNVLPIALVSMVLAVPGAIILEAALSFLGMGDPTSPTWGKMLHFARVTGGFRPMHMAWWAVFPPGLAITFLCLAFVFMGHAVDEIVNPRLRRRR